MKKIIACFLALSMLICMVPSVFAADNKAETAANRLYALNLMKGTGTNADGSPDFDLDGVLTREQAVIMLLRLLGKEEEANAAGMKMPFTDVSGWAANCVAYAYNTGLVNGTGATTFHGKREISAAEYVTLVLRTLGYSSETDFVWSSPWALSNAIGLTKGAYSSATTRFLRGDMAIVSANALDVTLKDGSKTLLAQIGLSNVSSERPSKEEYIGRIMTDARLAALKTASLTTLQKEISTIGDAVKFLDQFTPHAFSGFGGEIRLDLDFVYPLHTSPEATTPQTYAAFAAWCLADDYDGIQYVICTGENYNAFRISVALALPVANGYYLYAPYETSTLIDDDLCFSAEVLSLENLEDVLEFPWTTPKPLQIFVADAEQRTLKFITNEDVMVASVSQGSAETVYTISDEAKAEMEEAKKQQRIETAWNNLQRYWNSFGFPASFAPTLSKVQVEALIGKDIDTVAAELKTLGDVMYYLALSGYYTTNGDLKVWENNEFCWSFNESPQTVFANNAGNCGGTAGFVPFLLTGDYAEAGCISMTAAVEMGGGHVISYLKDGSTYYVFDSRALVDSNFSWNGGLSQGASIAAAGQQWRTSVDPNFKLMFAYPSDEGDMPALGTGKTVYLPTQYRDRITVVYEDTAEGYKFEWRTISAEVLKAIDGIRNPVSSRPGSDVLIDTSGNYLTRALTDEQLAELKYADLETLQAWISTVADAVAFLDQFTPNSYSRSGNDFRLDIDFLYDLHRRPEATFNQTYTSFAAWCLADDYDEIKFVICTFEEPNKLSASSALILPTRYGHLIYSPYERSNVLDPGDYAAIKTTEIRTLENLENTISTTRNIPLSQIYLANAEQINLRFILNDEAMQASVLSGTAELVYTMSAETKVELKEAERQERAQYAWFQLQNNWNSYGMPASLAPTMTKEEAAALWGKDIDTVAAACKTLGDCLYYYALSGFTGCSGDLQTRDGSIGSGNLSWHYNYAPAATFARNTGNCGASSGLTSYLLQGDYDQTGMLGMTFVEGAGGGHFINYLYDGSQYYVFDIVNLLAAFHQSGFCFSTGSTLKAAADNWIFISEYPVRLMWAYQSFDGDVPVGWDLGGSNISYLPAQYKDSGKILMETPSEGYVYQWVTINAAVQEQIDRTRNPD